MYDQTTLVAEPEITLPRSTQFQVDVIVLEGSEGYDPVLSCLEPPPGVKVSEDSIAFAPGTYTVDFVLQTKGFAFLDPAITPSSNQAARMGISAVSTTLASLSVQNCLPAGFRPEIYASFFWMQGPQNSLIVHDPTLIYNPPD